MRRLEKDIEDRACKRAFSELGVRNIKVNTLTETGWPDRMFLIPGGMPLFIEFKQPGEEPRAKQLHIHALLKGLGYLVKVCDNEEDAMEAIRMTICERSP